MNENERCEGLKARIKEFLLHAYVEARMLPRSRPQALVLTKLDEARQWLAECHPVPQDPVKL